MACHTVPTPTPMCLGLPSPHFAGYEPHSILPQGITVFSQYANDHMPEALRHDIRIMASSAVRLQNGSNLGICGELTWI